MNPAEFGIINLKQFQKHLDKFKKLADKQIKKDLKLAAMKIEKDARANAPVRTGVLKAGYHHNYEFIDEYEVSVETDVEYAPYVEFGTVHQDAQPHLEPALLIHEKDFLVDLYNDIENSWAYS